MQERSLGLWTHIDLASWLVYDHTTSKNIKLVKIESRKNIADCLTKSVKTVGEAKAKFDALSGKTSGIELGSS